MLYVQARTLGKHVVAEGVETTAQLEQPKALTPALAPQTFLLLGP